MFAIVDCGVGNLHSVASAFRAVGAETIVTSDAETLIRAEAIILPGVGAFPDAWEQLTRSGLIPVIRSEASHKPLLGICLGMQLLFTKSEEIRETQGLDLIPGTVRRIPTSEKLPQIGWNALTFPNTSRFFDGIHEGDYVYFVHSFMTFPAESADIAALTDYGSSVTAAVVRGFVYGCQFHPEKSGDVGLQIIRNFCRITKENP
ncbi:MAG: imidazole glycerol phosphate synthase subunit HisH [Eubacteriales bacterium]|jgi:glutamine amidotransferase